MHRLCKNLKAGIKSSPPNFKKRIKYKSFTLKQAGYKILQAERYKPSDGLNLSADPTGGGKNPAHNYIRIGKRIYRYFLSRKVEGNIIKTVTVKRDPLGDLYICIVTDATTSAKDVPRTGKSVGYDFGLK